jgi:hypothetical protein
MDLGAVLQKLRQDVVIVSHGHQQLFSRRQLISLETKQTECDNHITTLYYRNMCEVKITGWQSGTQGSGEALRINMKGKVAPLHN